MKGDTVRRKVKEENWGKSRKTNLLGGDFNRQLQIKKKFYADLFGPPGIRLLLVLAVLGG